MADGRHLEKSKKAVSMLRFGRLALNVALQRTLAIRRVLAIKISNL